MTAEKCRVLVKDLIRNIHPSNMKRIHLIPYNHRWELPGKYPVFNMVMVIYHYVERIGEFL